MIFKQQIIVLLITFSFMFVRRVQPFGHSPPWLRSFTSSRLRMTESADKSTLKPDWVLRFDGGSRGNPGLGGSGAAIYNFKSSGELNEVWRGYFFLGQEGITNNQAEYAGLIEGLIQSKKMNIQSIFIQGDSELVLKQAQGIYKVRHLKLIPLHRRVLRLLSSIPVKLFQHLPRADNWRADELSNMAMDRKTTMQAFSPEFAAFLEHHSEPTDSEPSESPLTSIDTLASVENSSESIVAAPVKPRRGRSPVVRSMEQTVDVLTIPLENIPAANIVAPMHEIIAPAKRRRRAVVPAVSAPIEEPVVVEEAPVSPDPATAKGKKKRMAKVPSTNAANAESVPIPVPIEIVVEAAVEVPALEEIAPAKKRRATKPKSTDVPSAPAVPVATPVTVTPTTVAQVHQAESAPSALLAHSEQEVKPKRTRKSKATTPAAVTHEPSPVLSVEATEVVTTLASSEGAPPVKKKRASRAKKVPTGEAMDSSVAN